MKKIILAVLITLSPMLAKDDVKIKNPFSQGRMGSPFLFGSLPHFMGMYMKRGGMHKIETTDEQAAPIEKQFKKMMKTLKPRRDKLRKLENEIVSKIVFEGKTKEELSTQISEAIKLKTEMTNIQIECLNVFKKALTQKQYQVMIDMSIKHSKEESRE